jgi:hypothetical protein
MLICKLCYLLTFKKIQSRYNSVSKDTGHGLDSWDLISGRGRDYFYHCVQTMYEAHPASYQIHTRHKAAEPTR